MKTLFKETNMEFTTTIREAPDRILALHESPETKVHIIIEDSSERRNRQNLLQRLRNFKPIDVGEKDIVETLREEREKADIRLLSK